MANKSGITKSTGFDLKKFSYKGYGIGIMGIDDLLKKFNSMDQNVTYAMVDAVIESGQIPKAYMQKFMAAHRDTGETERNFKEFSYWMNPSHTAFSYMAGYDIHGTVDDGEGHKGFPALFFDVGTRVRDADYWQMEVGTPLIKPTYFVYYAIANHYNDIKRKQQEYIDKAIAQAMG